MKSTTGISLEARQCVLAQLTGTRLYVSNCQPSIWPRARQSLMPVSEQECIVEPRVSSLDVCLGHLNGRPSFML